MQIKHNFKSNNTVYSKLKTTSLELKLNSPFVKVLRQSWFWPIYVKPGHT